MPPPPAAPPVAEAPPVPGAPALPAPPPWPEAPALPPAPPLPEAPALPPPPAPPVPVAPPVARVPPAPAPPARRPCPHRRCRSGSRRCRCRRCRSRSRRCRCRRSRCHRLNRRSRIRRRLRTPRCRRSGCCNRASARARRNRDQEQAERGGVGPWDYLRGAGGSLLHSGPWIFATSGTHRDASRLPGARNRGVTSRNEAPARRSRPRRSSCRPVSSRHRRHRPRPPRRRTSRRAHRPPRPRRRPAAGDEAHDPQHWFPFPARGVSAANGLVDLERAQRRAGRLARVHSRQRRPLRRRHGDARAVLRRRLHGDRLFPHPRGGDARRGPLSPPRRQPGPLPLHGQGDRADRSPASEVRRARSGAARSAGLLRRRAGQERRLRQHQPARRAPLPGPRRRGRPAVRVREDARSLLPAFHRVAEGLRAGAAHAT